MQTAAECGGDTTANPDKINCDVRFARSRRAGLADTVQDTVELARQDARLGRDESREECACQVINLLDSRRSVAGIGRKTWGRNAHLQCNFRDHDKRLTFGGSLSWLRPLPALEKRAAYISATKSFVSRRQQCCRAFQGILLIRQRIQYFSDCTNIEVATIARALGR